MTQFYVVGTKDLVEDLRDLRKSGYHKPGNPDLEIISIIQPNDKRWLQIMKISSSTVDPALENLFCAFSISKDFVDVCPNCGDPFYRFSVDVREQKADEPFRIYL